MKRKLAVILAAVMAVSLAACGNNGSSEESPSTDSQAADSSEDSGDGEVWNIGFSIRNSTDDFFVRFIEKITELTDADDTINLTVADAENDSQKQLDQLDNFNMKGMDAIILTPQDGSTVVDYVEQWNSEGIPVICWTQKSDGGDYTYVGCSDYDTGLLEGQWCAENLPEGANVLHLGGDLGFQTSIDRRQGFVDGLGDRLYDDWDGNVLNEDGDIHVLSWQYTMYTMEEGQTVTEDWIQTFDDFDAIVGCNDSVILGAREALLGAGIEDVSLVGIDALSDTLTAIKEGTVSATVMQSAEDQAQAVYDAIKELQAGGTPDKEIYPELTLIDASNVDKYIE